MQAEKICEMFMPPDFFRSNAQELKSALNVHLSANKILDKAPKALIACMPKSGSTWFTMLLEQSLGIPAVRSYLQPDRNEQEIDSLELFQSLGREVLFVQQHVKASETLLRLCRSFSVKIVFLTRCIDDAIVSFRDHLESESTVASMFYMEDDWFRCLSKNHQFDFLVDHCVPWYLNFVVGWVRAQQLHPDMVFHLRYEELIKNPSSSLTEVLRFLGRSGQMDATIFEKSSGTRFNQGRVGRGKEELSDFQLQRIKALAVYYGQVDLSSIGL